MRKAAKIVLAGFIGSAMALAAYSHGYLHGAMGALHGAQGRAVALRGAIDPPSPARILGDLSVTINEKPFGMHVRGGTAQVAEAFPGFPARKLGIHSGCEIRQVAGKPVSAGTWLQEFQTAAVPFSLKLFCKEPATTGHGPVSSEQHRYRVLVVKKPYGMNVQVNVLPRVVEVLPGYPAEAAGVKAGFVLTAVNDEPVDASNWHATFEKASLPCMLTFDTKVPLHEGNQFFNRTTSPLPQGPASATGENAGAKDDGIDDDDRFENFHSNVDVIPYGMAVSAPPVGGRPIVKSVVDGLPAAKEGVRAGDVLVEVAGRPVDSSSWFAAFQQAVPPFGLRFRRPLKDSERGALGNVAFTVSEKPFGMQVKRSTVTVQEVFPTFPAKKLGIRPGCQILEIAGRAVSQGTWLEVFQNTAMPFDMKMFCAPRVKKADGPLSKDEHKYRVLVTQRPFGMNVQVNVLPRVVEVLPGYPAEAAGVKRGFVLTEVNEKPVNASNWFDIWQKAPTHSTLTFDTNVPLHEGNPFFGASVAAPALPAPKAAAVDVGEGFTDFKCSVDALPFGLRVSAVPGGRPSVVGTVDGLPAASKGVQAGDILVEVAGLPVDSSNWFASFQQASPPFGLLFRRRIAAADGTSTTVAANTTASTVAPTA